MESFSYVDWARSREDIGSIYGHCVFVGGNLISWKSKKHNEVSRSSAKLVNRTMTQCVYEIMWMHQLLI